MFQTYLRQRMDQHMSDDKPTNPIHQRRPSPAPWHTDGISHEMAQEDGVRYATYVWASADDRLVAVAMGDTAGESQANAILFVELSKGLAAAQAAKAGGLPLPGEKLRVLVDEPSSAELQRGEVVEVVPNPDDEPGLGEPAVWVRDAGAGQWALDPSTRGIEWVVIPRD